MASLELNELEREELERLARSRTVGAAMAFRARIILECAKGLENLEVAEPLGVNKHTVGKWRRRFVASRLDGLLDEPRPGRPRLVSDADVERIVDTTLLKNPVAATHWSSRMLARQLGVSATAVQRVWRAFGLQQHRAESFSLSKDPLFIEKVRDIVGLYMSPPGNVVVLCVDEKSQMQALDRSSPLLPMQPTHPEQRTATYSRHGTTSLFAALDIATGRVIGKTFRWHRATEFVQFLGEIDRAVPSELDLHLVMDNYASHKTPEVKRWLLRHPRFHVHFTPTSSSWLNMVESFFSIVERRVTKRGVLRSKQALEKDARAFLEAHNGDPKPFVWIGGAACGTRSVHSSGSRRSPAVGGSTTTYRRPDRRSRSSRTTRNAIPLKGWTGMVTVTTLKFAFAPGAVCLGHPPSSRTSAHLSCPPRRECC